MEAITSASSDEDHQLSTCDLGWRWRPPPGQAAIKTTSASSGASIM